MSDTYGGILPALITPLTEDFAVNVDALEELTARLYSNGVHGLYTCGNTGEGPRLSIDARKLVLETVLRCTPSGKLVIAHVGAARIDDAIELARHAASAGAHVLSSLPPPGVTEFDAVRSYYQQLASCTDLPFLIYYFPENAPVIKTMDQIRELAGLPHVIGLKFTDFDLYRLSLLTRQGLTVFNGRDEVLAAGLLMGAHGGIGSFYNLVPELFLDVYRLSQAGSWAEARRIQDRINDLIELTLHFPCIPAIKEILGWCGVPCGDSLTARGLTNDEKIELRSALERAEFDPAGFLNARSAVS